MVYAADGKPQLPQLRIWRTSSVPDASSPPVYRRACMFKTKISGPKTLDRASHRGLLGQ
jgi:hypothetical protein